MSLFEDVRNSISVSAEGKSLADGASFSETENGGIMTFSYDVVLEAETVGENKIKIGGNVYDNDRMETSDVIQAIAAGVDLATGMKPGSRLRTPDGMNYPDDGFACNFIGTNKIVVSGYNTSEAGLEIGDTVFIKYTTVHNVVNDFGHAPFGDGVTNVECATIMSLATPEPGGMIVDVVRYDGKSARLKDKISAQLPQGTTGQRISIPSDSRFRIRNYYITTRRIVKVGGLHYKAMYEAKNFNLGCDFGATLDQQGTSKKLDQSRDGQPNVNRTRAFVQYSYTEVGTGNVVTQQRIDTVPKNVSNLTVSCRAILPSQSQSLVYISYAHPTVNRGSIMGCLPGQAMIDQFRTSRIFGGKSVIMDFTVKIIGDPEQMHDPVLGFRHSGESENAVPANAEPLIYGGDATRWPVTAGARERAFTLYLKGFPDTIGANTFARFRNGFSRPQLYEAQNFIADVIWKAVT